MTAVQRPAAGIAVEAPRAVEEAVAKERRNIGMDKISKERRRGGHY